MTQSNIELETQNKPILWQKFEYSIEICSGFSADLHQHH